MRASIGRQGNCQSRVLRFIRVISFRETTVKDVACSNDRGKVLRIDIQRGQERDTLHITKWPLLWLLRPLYGVILNFRSQDSWERGSHTYPLMGRMAITWILFPP